MSGTHGVFQHRTGYFYTILEEDFCEVYKTPGVNEVCRAYITSILENLTNKQFEATGRDEDIWVFMSLPEMARRMRHACSERTIHKELQGMVKDGFLSKRRAVGKATMEYKLNLKKLRKALEALPEVQPCNSATSYLANLQDQSGNSARSTLQNDKNHLANLQPRISKRLHEEYTEITEEREGAFASAHASLAHDLDNFIDEEEDDETIKAPTPASLKAIGATHASPAPVLPDRTPTLDRVFADEPEAEQSVPVEGEIHGQSIDRHRDRQHLPQHLASGPALGAAEHQERIAPTQRGHVRDTPGADDGLLAHPQQMTSDLSPTDGAAAERGSASRASGGKVHQQKAKKKPSEVQVTLEGQQIIEWYEEYRGLKVRRTDKQMIAANAIGARGVTKDDFLSVVALLDDDPWFEKNGIGIDLYWIERQFDNKYIFLKKRKKPESPKERTLGGYYFVGGQ